jgi:hypothetical protein
MSTWALINLAISELTEQPCMTHLHVVAEGPASHLAVHVHRGSLRPLGVILLLARNAKVEACAATADFAPEVVRTDPATRKTRSRMFGQSYLSDWMDFVEFGWIEG